MTKENDMKKILTNRQVKVVYGFDAKYRITKNSVGSKILVIRHEPTKSPVADSKDPEGRSFHLTGQVVQEFGKSYTLREVAEWVANRFGEAA